MPVSIVFDNLESGMSVTEITEVSDVTPEEVKAVLHFAFESLSNAGCRKSDTLIAWKLDRLGGGPTRQRESSASYHPCFCFVP
jgi:hypothetical protein